MTALTTYQTGTVSVSADGTVVTGSGAIWSGLNVFPGDRIVIDDEADVLITDVTDATHLTIPKWKNGNKSAVTYVIYQSSSLRFDDVQIALDLQKQVQAQNEEGFYHFVRSSASEPDPSLGDDGQYARQPSTKREWHKEGGVWIFDGTYTGIDPTGPWDSDTAYHNGSVAEDAGSSYMALRDNTNKLPASNPDDWMLLAAKGDHGATGTPGTNGTNGTAATIAVGTVTTVAYGQPATVTNVGTATAAEFDIEIPAGQDGTGTGDVVGPSSATAGAVAAFDGTTGKLVKELTAAQVRTAAGATTVGAAVLTATDAAAARAAIGAAVPQAINSQTFTSSGTFTTPAGSTTATVYRYRMVGGGGGGGGANASTAAAGGGGAGAYAEGTFTGVAASTGITITVGAAGSGGSAGATGTAGGSSSIGSPVSVTAGGGAPGVGTSSSVSLGGVGGTITAGTPDILSLPGAKGFPGVVPVGGTPVVSGGDGVNTPLGYAGMSGYNNVSGSGSSAVGYGSSGGGAFSTGGIGGGGRPGVVIVDWVL